MLSSSAPRSSSAAVVPTASHNARWRSTGHRRAARKVPQSTSMKTAWSSASLRGWACKRCKSARTSSTTVVSPRRTRKAAQVWKNAACMVQTWPQGKGNQPKCGTPSLPVTACTTHCTVSACAGAPASWPMCPWCKPDMTLATPSRNVPSFGNISCNTMSNGSPGLRRQDRMAAVSSATAIEAICGWRTLGERHARSSPIHSLKTSVLKSFALSAKWCTRKAEPAVARMQTFVRQCTAGCLIIAKSVPANSQASPASPGL
mmetsp:Transcript_68963/g.200075  ORF Transcript_68963/g.200075 Transcript_68963/m.200075 type:complete len:260 (+) Transcript_68963:534-1313(+)